MQLFFFRRKLFIMIVTKLEFARSHGTTIEFAFSVGAANVPKFIHA
jgi:hypothetical protein